MVVIRVACAPSLLSVAQQTVAILCTDLDLVQAADYTAVTLNSLYRYECAENVYQIVNNEYCPALQPSNVATSLPF